MLQATGMWFRAKFTPRQISFMLMLVSMVCLPGMDAIVKYMAQSLPVLEIIWARYTGHFVIILLVFAPQLSKVLKTSNIKVQLARSVALFCTTILFFQALVYIEQGQATAIFQIAPMIMSVLAVLFLKERLGPRRIISLVFGFVGAMVIIQPQGEQFTLASCLPLAAAACYAVYSILTRYLGAAESAYTTLIYTAGFGAIVSSIILPFVWVPPETGFEVFLLLLIPMIGGIGHFTLIQALQMTEASDLAPMNYLSLVFAMMWGALIFAEVPSPSTVAGGCLIVASGIYLLRRSRGRS
jgi:drug/metabolite transporter (DMT)-like permease